MANPYDFPADLIAFQQEIHQTRAELRALLAALPWSVEAHEGWADPADRWHPTQRPATPGWTGEEKEAVAVLRARERELAALITSHRWWEGFSGKDVVDARMALKRLTPDDGTGPAAE
ncbi:hypothetical protein [Streptomyces sp. NPDC053048]|uniref:hypothetical protein n=1 Tax=Streptomyces sp. NPDC053048 TaxID=3365694 RepID=UPI0037CF85E1